MRNIPGRTVSVNGRSVYVEETGAGQDWVVFEAGMSCWPHLLGPGPAAAGRPGAAGRL